MRDFSAYRFFIIRRGRMPPQKITTNTRNPLKFFFIEFNGYTIAVPKFIKYLSIFKSVCYSAM